MKNYITEYSQQLTQGKIIASRRVKAVYSRLATSTVDRTGQYVFDEGKANRPIEFIERFCKHSKGEWAGQPVRLELFQKAYIQALFGFVDKETGYRQYRESFFLVGRKNGKSTLLAGLSLYMLTSDGEGGAEGCPDRMGGEVLDVGCQMQQMALVAYQHLQSETVIGRYEVNYLVGKMMHVYHYAPKTGVLQFHDEVP